MSLPLCSPSVSMIHPISPAPLPQLEELCHVERQGEEKEKRNKDTTDQGEKRGPLFLKRMKTENKEDDTEEKEEAAAPRGSSEEPGRRGSTGGGAAFSFPNLRGATEEWKVKLAESIALHVAPAAFIPPPLSPGPLSASCSSPSPLPVCGAGRRLHSPTSIEEGHAGAIGKVDREEEGGYTEPRWPIDDGDMRDSSKREGGHRKTMEGQEPFPISFSFSTPEHPSATEYSTLSHTSCLSLWVPPTRAVLVSVPTDFYTAGGRRICVKEWRGVMEHARASAAQQEDSPAFLISPSPQPGGASRVEFAVPDVSKKDSGLQLEARRSTSPLSAARQTRSHETLAWEKEREAKVRQHLERLSYCATAADTALGYRGVLDILEAGTEKRVEECRTHSFCNVREDAQSKEVGGGVVPMVKKNMVP